MEVLASTVRAGYQPTVLAIELIGVTWLDDLPCASLARESPWAAGTRGKDVVCVHGADDEGGTGPLCLTPNAHQRHVRTAEALHADSTQVQSAMLVIGDLLNRD